MKIIISPAKKMNENQDLEPFWGLPVLLEDAGILLEWMRSLTYDEAKKLWKCNDKIASLNYERINHMDLEKRLTPAILTYEGLQYQYMAPAVFEEGAMRYIQDHLRILSGFYGILRPFDGVTPYRLEMQAAVKAGGVRDLYEFWGDKLYQELLDEDRTVLNLASKEYSRCIERYLCPEDQFVTCVFGEWVDGKVKQKGTLAKMARGEMVRYMAENNLSDLQKIRGFDRLGYHFSEELSTQDQYVFLKR